MPGAVATTPALQGTEGLVIYFASVSKITLMAHRAVDVCPARRSQGDVLFNPTYRLEKPAHDTDAKSGVGAFAPWCRLYAQPSSTQFGQNGHTRGRSDSVVRPPV